MPSIRALYAQLLVEGVDVTPQRQQVQDAVDPAVIKLVMDAHRLAFIEAAPHQALLDASCAVLGPDGLRKLIVRQTKIFSDSPLMGATVRTLLKLTRATPHSFLRHLPRLRDATVRDYGTLQYTSSSSRSAAFALRGYPPIYTNEANLELFKATFEAAVELTGDAAGVEVVAWQDGAGDFVVRWGS